MDPVLSHHSLCPLVVNLEMKCNSSMAIGRVYEVDLSYLSCKDLIPGDLSTLIGQRSTGYPQYRSSKDLVVTLMDNLNLFSPAGSQG